ncbi:MAG: hypothetical protein AAF799_11750 [Myxococcota bacterium]
MPNTVTPKVTIASGKLWFDPAGQRIKPTKVEFSVTQSAHDPADPYPGGGTIVRSAGNISLYRDADRKDEIVFAENRARVTHDELFAGNGTSKTFTAYVSATAESGVQKTKLSLELDPLDTSELKKTNFTTRTVEDRFTVATNDPGSSVELELETAALIAPELKIGSAVDPEVRALSAKPYLPISCTAGPKPALPLKYEDDATLELSPSDADILVFADEKGKTAVPVVDGKITVPNAELMAAKTYWLAAGPKAKTADVNLTLSLPVQSNPSSLVALGPACKRIRSAQQNTVKPVIGVQFPDELEGALWFPGPKSVAPPTVTLHIDQSNQEHAPYLGHGLLTRSSSALTVYWDARLEAPIEFYDDKLVLENAVLTGKDPLTLYLVGSKADDVTLSLSLYDPKLSTIAIAETSVSASVPIQAVNIVTPHIEYEGPIVRSQLTPVRIFVTQTDEAKAPYRGKATLVRDNQDLQFFAGKSDGKGTNPLFSGSEATAVVPDITGTTTYYAQWNGEQTPAKRVRPSLELQAASSAVIITDPSTQLAPPPPRPTFSPPIIEHSNIIKPVIDTDYDVLPLWSIAQIGAEKAAPIKARIHVEQTAEAVRYEQDGILTRTSANLQVFLDAECTCELSFNASNEARVPNAWLVDTKKVYYLRGVTAGACSLTLQPLPPKAEFPAPPAISVQPAELKKDLAVTKLTLQVWRDDGTQASAKMSTREQRLRGRFVTVKDPSKPLGRAKVVIEKVDVSAWPASAKDHQVMLSVEPAISGKNIIELYDQSTGGKVCAQAGTSLLLSKAEASSEDKVVWAQGKEASGTIRDVRLSLGLFRTDADPLTVPPLENADWATMTSVAIEKVTPQSAGWEQYVNQPPDRAKTFNDESVPEFHNGRQILVTATTKPARAGIPVDLVLWGFDGNGAAASTDPRTPLVGNDLKAQTTHVAASTDVNGRASARLKLSRYGGDQFYAVAFLSDDAKEGMSKYGAKGNDAPANTKTTALTVWQKLEYTLTAMKQSNGTDDYGDYANEPNFIAQYQAAKIKISKKGGKHVVAHKNILDINDAVGSWWNTNGQASVDRVFNLLFCDNITTGVAPVEKTIENPAFPNATSELDGIYDLSDWRGAGPARVQKKDGTFLSNIDNTKVKLAYSGPCKYELSVDLTGAANVSGVPTDQLIIYVPIKEYSAISGCASATAPVTCIGVRLRQQAEAPGNSTSDSANNTMWHEVGHYMGLTAMKVPVPNASLTGGKELNVYWYQGISGSGTNYNEMSQSVASTMGTFFFGAAIGVGDHCRNDSTGWNYGPWWINNPLVQPHTPKCIMFHALTNPPILNYCSTCIDALKARDLSLSNVAGSADF